MKRPVISSLWIKGDLSYIELLSLKSYIDCGHEVKLYHYGPLNNVPDWLNTYDANEICEFSQDRLDAHANTQTILANIFRVHLNLKTDEVWSDCDVYCIRPVPDDDYIFVTESVRPVQIVNNSFFRVPRDCPAIVELADFLSTDYPMYPESLYFFDKFKNKKHEFEALGGNGNVHFRDMAWGTSGPRALSYFLAKHDLLKYAWPTYLHAPLVEGVNSQLARPRASRKQLIPVTTQSIHFFGSSLRRRLINNPGFVNNEPIEGSFLSGRLRDHGIDPKFAPLVGAVGKAEHLKNKINLED